MSLFTALPESVTNTISQQQAQQAQQKKSALDKISEVLTKVGTPAAEIAAKVKTLKATASGSGYSASAASAAAAAASNQDATKSGMSTTTKVILGVTVAGALLGGYFAFGRKKSSGMSGAPKKKSRKAKGK